MSAVVVDTHTLIWYASKDPRLSATARAALVNAEQTGVPIFVPAIIVVELRYLVEKRTITEAEFGAIVAGLKNPATASAIAPLDLAVAEAMEQIPRATVPDMPDRIIAATALCLGLPLVTRDSRICALTNISTVW